MVQHTNHQSIITILMYLVCVYLYHDTMYDFVVGGPNKNGTVLEVKGWEGETDVSLCPKMLLCVCTSFNIFINVRIYFVAILQRSVVEVAWILTGTTNIYRLGHKGKVCVLISMIIFYH